MPDAQGAQCGGPQGKISGSRSHFQGNLVRLEAGLLKPESWFLDVDIAGRVDPHYIFFATIEVAAMLLTVWLVWKEWPAA